MPAKSEVAQEAWTPARLSITRVPRIGRPVDRDRNTRIQAIKRISFHLPFRPLLKFLHMYVWKRGFLDGAAGFHCCALMGVFEYMIGLRVREMRRRAAGEPV